MEREVEVAGCQLAPQLLDPIAEGGALDAQRQVRHPDLQKLFV
jgi:hypothetical protein